MRSVNGLMESWIDYGDVLFTYDEITQKVSLHISENITILLGDKLVKIMGYGQNSFTSGVHTAQKVVDAH